MCTMPALDHLVYAVPDLDAAVIDLARRTGVQPVFGGVHPGRGTRNALIGLSWRGTRRSYLELLGPDPDQPPVRRSQMLLGLGGLLKEDADFEPRMHTWAIRPDDMITTLKRARKAGVETGTPVAAARKTPAGTKLAWQLAVPEPLGLGGVQPFLIEWNGHHPSDDNMPTLELLDLQLKHPDERRATQVLSALGVGISVRSGKHPRIRATLGTPEGEVVLK